MVAYISVLLQSFVQKTLMQGQSLKVLLFINLHACCSYFLQAINGVRWSTYDSIIVNIHVLLY